jgi:hypothetical protein
MGNREREGGRRQTEGWEGDEQTCGGHRWVQLCVRESVQLCVQISTK